nr:LuxR family transcriptional regulator [Actinomadura rugatobispora]
MRPNVRDDAAEWQEVPPMTPEDPALVERDGDLAAVVAALARPPAFVVVEGEPGAGKTRLVREALADPSAARGQRLFGRAWPAPEQCTLAPVFEALASARPPHAGRLGPLTGVLRPVLPHLAGVLPPEPPPLGDPPLDDPRLARHRLVRAAADLLAGLGPALLVVDDAHWADEGTIELLRLIGTRPPAELSVVITCRSPAGPSAGAPAVPSAVRVRLAPLTRSGAARLVRAVLDDPRPVLPRRLADRLYERHGGVPFAVREDVALLRRRGLLRPVNGEWTLAPVAGAEAGAEAGADAGVGSAASAPVPPAVAAEILSRVAGLGTAERAALEAAAVLGTADEPGLVARVAGMDAEQACAALGEVTGRGLLRDHGPGRGSVRFRHELARLAIYQAIPGCGRRRLHEVAARELLRTGQGALAVRAAAHHQESGDVQGWAETAETAARLAAADGLYEDAHACLRDVLQADAVGEDARPALAAKLGWAASGGVDRTGTTSALLAATLEHDIAPPELRAELLLLRAWASARSTVPRRERAAALAGLRAAIGDLAGRPDLRAIALAVLALPDGLPGRDLRAQVARLCQAHAALAGTDDPMARVVVQVTTARLLLALGSPAARHAADALPAHGDRPEVNRQLVQGLLDLAEEAAQLGHRAYALKLVERARRAAAGVRSHTYDRRLRVVELGIRWTTGDLGAEDRAVSPSGDDPLVQDPAGASPHARVLAGRISAGQGRLDVARRTLHAVAQGPYRTGEELAAAVHAVAEYDRVASTDAHRALGLALTRRVVDELARRHLWWWAAPLLPFAPLEVVRAVLPRYRGALTGLDVPLARAALDFAEARVHERYGDPDRAAAGYRRARRAYAALPDPRLAAHAAAAEVGAKLAAGRPADAGPLRHAWSTFTGLGAPWDADRLKPLMRAAGLPTHRRRGRPAYGNELSPREREVAGLAASGHTNRDIAATLCLSDRTVKFHLANAMRKLQVGNRRQLRDVLAPRDHVCRCARCGWTLQSVD